MINGSLSDKGYWLKAKRDAEWAVEKDLRAIHQLEEARSEFTDPTKIDWCNRQIIRIKERQNKAQERLVTIIDFLEKTWTLTT